MPLWCLLKMVTFTRGFASLLSLFLFCQTCAWNQDHPTASPQIAGRFYLEKNTYSLGEPVFLYFEASNPGTKAHEIISADPYSFCAGYEIRLSSDPSPTSRCAIRQPGGSCASSSRTLPPDGSYTERILLNYDHKIDEPGYYVVDAARSMPHGVDPSRGMMGPNRTILMVRERLPFLVGPAEFTSEELAKWLGRLHSGDNESRREAARTLASLAPLSLEDTLIGLADSGDLWAWVPLAMHRLNTPRSMAVLAKIVGSQPEGDQWQAFEAGNYLGMSGDPQWFPVLLAADRKRRDAAYLDSAAESGGDRAVPFLIGLVHSGTGLARQTAIGALGYTGSRSAVPLLLDLLNDSDSDTSERALFGLRELTRRALPGTSSAPQVQYPKWLAWWTRHGDSAPIYKPTDCDGFIPLDQD